MPVVRVTLFKYSDFDFIDLGLTVGSYSFFSNYYIQARAIYLAKDSTVSNKIKNRARLLAVDIEINRNTSVNYTLA